MRKFNVGVIELGHQASEDHIPALLSSDLVKLKAVVVTHMFGFLVVQKKKKQD